MSLNDADPAGRRSDGFSLLLPVYAGDNPDQFLLAFESSVTAQTLKPAEVLIVQDGPIPEALTEVIAKVRRTSEVPVQLLQLPENRGLSEALNAGLLAVGYDVIARMDADDVSEPERFAKQWQLLQDGFDLVGTGMLEFEDDPSVTGSRRMPPVGAERIRAHARTHSPFNHPTVMYRLTAVEKAGGYEPFGKMEDYWLWVRMLAGGARAENLADPLVKYRVGAGAFARRGGFSEAMTEVKLQRAMRRIGFISRGEYLRNVVMKSVYRVLPERLKRMLFSRFVAGGLPGDR